MSPYEISSLTLQVLTLLGLGLAGWQIKLSSDSLRAQTLFKLIDEWRDPVIYSAFQYVSQLRDKWQASSDANWATLADQWVTEHKNPEPDASPEDRKRLSNEWLLRRTASQFLAKMAALIEAGYLTPDAFFSVNPEAARQLAVLWPIEKAIERRFSFQVQAIPHWDRAFPKWEFSILWKFYERWYTKKGAAKCQLTEPPNALKLKAVHGVSPDGRAV